MVPPPPVGGAHGLTVDVSLHDASTVVADSRAGPSHLRSPVQQLEETRAQRGGHAHDDALGDSRDDVLLAVVGRVEQMVRRLLELRTAHTVSRVIRRT